MSIGEELNTFISGLGKGNALRRMSGVLPSEDFTRIAALPRRVYSKQETLEIQTRLSEVFGKGSAKLLPLQALALLEIGLYRGLLGPIGVGQGKTLLTLLAPHCINAQRPLLLLPAALIDKTKIERERYAKDFHVCYHITMQSYESMGRQNFDKYLFDLKPDMILCDEAHRIKNPKAAVTRRVKRYMRAHPDTVFAPLSGTIIGKSLLDFGHLADWALGESSPLPLHYGALSDWANAVDHYDEAAKTRIHAGVLTAFSGGSAELGAVRQGVRDRLVQSRGVVASEETSVQCSLNVNKIYLNPCDEITDSIVKLRSDWETPDGWPLMAAIDIYRHANELALGFFYRWNPRPPEDWLEARRAWASFVRTTLANNRMNLDSPLQVANACIAGKLDDSSYRDWKRIEPSFTPNPETVWVSDYAIDKAIEWARKAKQGIIFVSHVAFGKRLSERTGLPFFRKQGRDDSDNYIEDADGVIIASIASNAEGRNLQKWSKALLVTPPSQGKVFEQILGRCHRIGQAADSVKYDVFLSCSEHERAFKNALGSARLIEDVTGQKQKLNFADLTTDRKLQVRNSPLWAKI